MSGVERSSGKQQCTMPVMKSFLVLLACIALVSAADLRLGIVGTDTSHVTAFTKTLNDPNAPDHVAGARIVAAYKGGGPAIESSRSRIDRFTAELKDTWGVQHADAITEP